MRTLIASAAATLMVLCAAAVARAQDGPTVAGVFVGMPANAAAEALAERGFAPGGAPLPELPGPTFDAAVQLMIEGADGFSVMLAPALSIKSGEPVGSVDFNDPANVAPWKRFYEKGDEGIELQFAPTPDGARVQQATYILQRPGLDQAEAAAMVQDRYAIEMKGDRGRLVVEGADGGGGDVGLRASFRSVPRAHLRLELKGDDLAKRNVEALRAAVKARRPATPPSF